MRVATYNIRHGAPAGRRADLSGLQSAVTSLAADVIALQEVDRRVVRSCFADQAARLGRATGLSAHFVSARSLGPWSGYGNALLVRGTPSRVARRWLHSAGEQRAAIFAVVELDGGPVTVVSTHLQNRRAGRPAEAPDQLDEVLAELRQWPEPWVLMGDLNLRADVVLPRLDAAGLDAVPSTPTHPAELPRVRIDWIAVRGLEIRSWEVPALAASDHRPIVAELGVRGAPEAVSDVGESSRSPDPGDPPDR